MKPLNRKQRRTALAESVRRAALAKLKTVRRAALIGVPQDRADVRAAAHDAVAAKLNDIRSTAKDKSLHAEAAALRRKLHS